MEPDLSLVIGLVVAVFAIPAMVSAISDGRPPRAASVAVLIAGGLIVYAINTKENGYRMDQIPGVIYRVIGQFTG
ncbi:hypothetical protein ACOXXX_10610 [Thalassococcus sp. BH17M4-6]|uniref:hypothetical protein n=1 Tax=Thalassococcus sp. BH17M4-6 TaxID=3413148 RepID=UPI003BC03DF2